MSRVARLAGAILAETQGNYYLVGDLKEPCDFAAVGFESPGPINAVERPYIRLVAARAIVLSRPCLRFELEGDALSQLLAARLLIQRNGSVSDRLWRVLIHNPQQSPGVAASVKDEREIDARWFGEVPAHVWQIVRDQLLKCS